MRSTECSSQGVWVADVPPTEPLYITRTAPLIKGKQLLGRRESFADVENVHKPNSAGKLILPQSFVQSVRECEECIAQLLKWEIFWTFHRTD